MGLRTYFQKYCLRKFVPKNNPSEKLRKEFPRSSFVGQCPLHRWTSTMEPPPPTRGIRPASAPTAQESGPSIKTQV